LEEKTAVILEHARALIKMIGEPRAMLQMRRHVAWYTRGWPGVSRIRQRAFKMVAYTDLENLLDDYREGKFLPANPSSGEE